PSAHHATSIVPRTLSLLRPPIAPYTTLFRSTPGFGSEDVYGLMMLDAILSGVRLFAFGPGQSSGRSARLHKALVERKLATEASSDRKSTRLNSSHVSISYAVFCLQKKTSSSS